MQQASYVRVDKKVLAACRKDPARLARLIDGQLKPGRRVELGDAWDGIHFLLSARRRAGAEGDRGDPFGLALLGGDPLNPYVLDPAAVVRCLEPAAVARADRALQKLGGGQLHRRYDPPAMEQAGVRAGDWIGRGEQGFEYLLDAFLQWRELYHRAAEESQAVICAIK